MYGLPAIEQPGTVWASQFSRLETTLGGALPRSRARNAVETTSDAVCDFVP